MTALLALVGLVLCAAAVWLALRLDRVSGHTLGWLIPLVCGTVVGWPLTMATEVDRYRVLLSGALAALLLVAYVAAKVVQASRARNIGMKA